jgi:hypothetical protein
LLQMGKNAITYVVLPGVLLAAASFSGVALSKFEAYTEGNMVVVTWQAEQGTENGVAAYILDRKTDLDHGWREVATLSYAGSAAEYTYQDKTLYKMAANQVEYRLRVRYSNGSVETFDQKARADYTSTAVRRTWGSIKAMFQ